MQPNYTVLVPVYNEAPTLPQIMPALADACPNAEILYIDDGSTDGSGELLQQLKREQDTVLLRPHGGKGAAIRAGLQQSSGEYTVIQDADLEYDPHQIPMLIQKAQECDGCAVFGSRFLRPNPNLYKRYLLGNKVLTWVMNTLFRAHLTDSYTCYKLLPTKLFQSLDLQSDGFEMEAEICAKCLKRGIPIKELPINYQPRRLEEGKKIRFRDAWIGLKMMVKIRFRS